jgi:hypothetical protein
MMTTKEEWLTELYRLSQRRPKVEEDKCSSDSPAFRYGMWRFAVEHVRKYRSVVTQWEGDPKEMPTPPKSWRICPSSDQKKGWHYRIDIDPQTFHTILDAIDEMVPAAIDGQFPTKMECEKQIHEVTPALLLEAAKYLEQAGMTGAQLTRMHHSKIGNESFKSVYGYFQRPDTLKDNNLQFGCRLVKTACLHRFSGESNLDVLVEAVLLKYPL